MPVDILTSRSSAEPKHPHARRADGCPSASPGTNCQKHPTGRNPRPKDNDHAVVHPRSVATRIKRFSCPDRRTPSPVVRHTLHVAVNFARWRMAAKSTIAGNTPYTCSLQLNAILARRWQLQLRRAVLKPSCRFAGWNELNARFIDGYSFLACE